VGTGNTGGLGSSLPATGSSSAPLTLLAIMAILVGGLLVLASRRQSTITNA
jgi:LPXTG-motif cell wall-anchored protein